LVAIPAYFYEAVHDIYDVFGALVVEACVEHRDEKLEDRGPKNKF
jgi:hypothetical protein